ncbi:MAG: hypothetical protein H0U10_11050 [Chloroflexia bacterium]|nr:hypothetical protein [Chloroflexia bacterium]
MQAFQMPTADHSLFTLTRKHVAESAPSDAEAAASLEFRRGTLYGAEEAIRAYDYARGAQGDAYDASVDALAHHMGLAAAFALAVLDRRDAMPVAAAVAEDLVRQLDRMGSGAAPGDLSAYFEVVPEAARDEVDRVARHLDGR